MEELKYFFEHIEVLLKWKNLVIGITAAFSLLGLSFISFFHDILEDMSNAIVISCIFFTILVICKIAFQLTELISWKKSIEKERQAQIEHEQEILNLLKSLSKNEISKIKYLWTRSEHIAFFPSDDIVMLSLLRKGLINQLEGARKNIEKILTNTQSTIAFAFYIPEKIISIIRENKNELMPLWRKVKKDTEAEYFN